MKITKEYLREIILEELNNEAGPNWMTKIGAGMDRLGSATKRGVSAVGKAVADPLKRGAITALGGSSESPLKPLVKSTIDELTKAKEELARDSSKEVIQKYITSLGRISDSAFGVLQKAGMDVQQIKDMLNQSGVNEGLEDFAKKITDKTAGLRSKLGERDIRKDFMRFARYSSMAQKALFNARQVYFDGKSERELKGKVSYAINIIDAAIRNLQPLMSN